MQGDKFAAGFYGSEAWKRCRAAYKASKRGLCEDCLKKGLITPGTEVHHIRPLTPENLGNPEITLSWDNLALLCEECHDLRHEEMRGTSRRWRVSESGEVSVR